MTRIVRSQDEPLSENNRILLRIPRPYPETATGSSAFPKLPEVELQETVLKRQQDELKKRQAEADAKGYADGLQRAAAEQKAAISAKMKRLEELMQSLEKLKDEFRESLEDAVVDLSLGAVLKIIGAHVWTAQQIRDYVKRTADRSGYLPARLTVKLSPGDYESLVGELQQADPETVKTLSGITWEPDTRVALGGCILESPKGHLDLRVESRLERLKESLLEARRRPS